MVRAEFGETLAALRAGTERIDVWWGAPGTAMEDAADEGLLQPYGPGWLRQPGVGQPDPEGRWQVSQISPFVIAFNRERVPLAEAPTDWIDLFHHGWAEDVVLLDPTRSPEMAHFMSAMIVEALRDDDDLDRGFDWLARLDGAASEYVAEPGEAIRRLAGGQASLAVLPRHAAEAARHDDAPWIYYRIAESGAPMLSRGVAVAAGSAETELARVFVDLTGTVEVGTVARLHTRWMPGHGDVDMSRLPDDFEIDMQWTPHPLGPDTIARERDGWIERWELEVRGRGPA